jgi:hypothetical protein
MTKEIKSENGEPIMHVISDQEYKQFQTLKKVYIHSELANKYPDIYFICGEGGEKDEMGLPETILVCPSFGLDGMAMYKKHKDYSAPGW